VVAYLILRQLLHDELQALAITELIPVIWALGFGLIRRGRIDPIALAAAVVLLAAIAVSIADGGSALPLKLRRGMVTGSIGLACLGSVALGRPLLPAVVRLVARVWPESAGLTRRLSRYAAGHGASGLTVIIGVTLLADATAQVALAVSVSTAVFVGTARLARTGIFAAGLAACWIYAARLPPPAGAPGDLLDADTPRAA